MISRASTYKTIVTSGVGVGEHPNHMFLLRSRQENSKSSGNMPEKNPNLLGLSNNLREIRLFSLRFSCKHFCGVLDRWLLII